MIEKNMIVIFSGYNQRAVIAFLRCLAKNYIEDYVIIASSDHDMILKTEYRDKVFCIRQKKELNLDEITTIFGMVRKKYAVNYFLIPPTTESLNRFLLEHRDILERQHCIIPLVDKELYITISDKYNFWRLCKEKGFVVPANVEIGENYTGPYVAKPKHYMTKDGHVYSPVLVLTREVHNDFLSKYDKDAFTYQEYIVGDSYYLLYYIATNGRIYSFSQVNYAQQLNGKSILAAEATDIHNQDISKKYMELFHNLNYYGFIMVELRKAHGIYYMIEANPRFWGPSQLCVDAGVGFFERFLQDYNFLSDVRESNINYETVYLWSGGCDTEIINSKECVWLGEGKQRVTKQWKRFLKMDIYHRTDTINIFEIEKGLEV